MVKVPPPFELATWIGAYDGKVEYNLGSSNVQIPIVEELLPLVPQAPTRGEGFAGSLVVRQRVGSLLGLPPDQVQLTAGASEANFIAYLCGVAAGQQVLVESPTYSPLESIAAALEQPLRRVPRDPAHDFALPLERVHAALDQGGIGKTGLVVLTNLNNPTGAAMGKVTLRALARLCADYRAHLFIDETFRWLDLAQTVPLVAACRDIHHPDGGCVAISSGSLSKVYNLGASRVGWLAADEPFLRLVRGVRETMNPVLSPLCEHLAAVALERHDRILDRTLSLVGKNRSVAQRWAATRSDLRWIPSNGITAFPEVTNPTVDVGELALQLVRDHSTLISPGSYFGFPRHFRIGLGGDPDRLGPGLERVGMVLDALGHG